MEVRKALIELADTLGVKYEENVVFSRHCLYGTGGNADIFFYPKTAEEVKAIENALKEIGSDYFILGAGSNVLVSDNGYRGAVISTEMLKGITVKGKILTAMSGEKLSDVVKYALYNSLGGIEFLSGIPATVGGAVAMNAGCFNKCVGDYISYVVASDGVYTKNNCGFGYRESVFKDRGICVLSATFNLENVEYEQSEGKVAYYTSLRRNRQPKGRSCGSVFKNEGFFAGKVIESCNLKGMRIGSAVVSEKHANFILADKNGKSGDISRLIKHIKKTVYEKCGVEFHEELIYVGEFDDEDQL